MCAALRNRLDVMHESSEDVSALFFAHLTERMPCQMSVTNPAPRAAIPLVLIIAARKVLVVSLHNFLVLLAVAALSVCKIWTSCHSTRAFRFSGHRFTSIAA